MHTRGALSLRWLVLATLTSSALRPSEATVTEDCGECLRGVGKPLFGKVGVELTKRNQNGGSGFVYSELKLLHRLAVLFGVGSPSVKSAITTFLGLNESCVSACQALDDVIGKMTIGQQQITFGSRIYLQAGREYQPHVSALGGVTPTDFTQDPQAVLSEINDGFRALYGGSYSSYLEDNLDPQTDFFLQSALKVDPSVFGPAERLTCPNIFRDLDGNDHSVTWVNTTVDVSSGSLYRQPGDTKMACFHIRIVRSEINNGSLYMFYFQPIFELTDTDLTLKGKCIQYIFQNLEELIDVAIHERYSYGIVGRYDTLSFPLVHIGTDTDLKPIFNTDMGDVFSREQISELYSGSGDSLHELRTWDYFYNAPESTQVREVKTPLKYNSFLYSPFVFVMMDKATRVILKTGAYLRPKTSSA